MNTTTCLVSAANNLNCKSKIQMILCSEDQKDDSTWLKSTVCESHIETNKCCVSMQSPGVQALKRVRQRNNLLHIIVSSVGCVEWLFGQCKSCSGAKGAQKQQRKLPFASNNID